MCDENPKYEEKSELKQTLSGIFQYKQDHKTNYKHFKAISFSKYS